MSPAPGTVANTYLKATYAPMDTPPLISPLDPSRHATRKRALFGLAVAVLLVALGYGGGWAGGKHPRVMPMWVATWFR